MSKSQRGDVVFYEGPGECLIVTDVQKYRITYGIYNVDSELDGTARYLCIEDGSPSDSWEQVQPVAQITVKFDGDARLYTEEWCLDPEQASKILHGAWRHASDNLENWYGHR